MDTYSEEYRHLCEARTALAMPLLARKAHLVRVEAKRGLAERRRLETTMHGLWVDKQARHLAGLNEQARLDRMQALAVDNKAQVMRKIESRMQQVMDERSGIAANDDGERAA